jgi:hypothetical protein
MNYLRGAVNVAWGGKTSTMTAGPSAQAASPVKLAESKSPSNDAEALKKLQQDMLNLQKNFTDYSARMIALNETSNLLVSNLSDFYFRHGDADTTFATTSRAIPLLGSAAASISTTVSSLFHEQFTDELNNAFKQWNTNYAETMDKVEGRALAETFVNNIRSKLVLLQQARDAKIAKNLPLTDKETKALAEVTRQFKQYSSALNSLELDLGKDIATLQAGGAADSIYNCVMQYMDRPRRVPPHPRLAHYDVPGAVLSVGSDYWYIRDYRTSWQILNFGPPKTTG